MAEDTEATADPSMEEILASIRKIISDENPPAEVAPAAPEPDGFAPVLAAAAQPEDDEVLELTQMVQDDGSVTDVNAAPVEEVVAAPPPPPPVPVAAPAPVAPQPIAVVQPVISAETLVSDPVATTAASALSSLANTVEIDRLSSAPNGATFIGNGHRTLEDMVIELMRPLLKSWLDQNLPTIVERLVQKEIERIAKRS